MSKRGQVVISKDGFHMVLTEKEYYAYINPNIPYDVRKEGFKRGKHYKRELESYERRGQKKGASPEWQEKSKPL